MEKIREYQYIRNALEAKGTILGLIIEKILEARETGDKEAEKSAVWIMERL